jgi:hypothetical protein
MPMAWRMSSVSMLLLLLLLLMSGPGLLGEGYPGPVGA